MSSTGPFDAVLCDLDGVLRRWPPQGMEQLDLAYDLPAGTLAKAAFSPARLLPAITGICTDEQWRSAVAADLTDACGSVERAHRLVTEWSAIIAEVDEEVAGLLASIRQSMPVLLVTNATSRLKTDLDRLEITSLAHDVVNSAELGFAKPDQRIYHTAASRAGVPPNRCLFIDDVVENTDAAHAAGMIVIHFQDSRQLRDAFTSLLA